MVSKKLGLAISCLFLVACANSGSAPAQNSSGANQTAGGEVAQNGVTMTGGQPMEMEEPDYEDSFADAE
jgi:hypothetical protein